MTKTRKEKNKMDEVVDVPEKEKAVKAAAAVVIQDGKVLLVQEGEGSSHITGMLGIPSGRMDPGESERDAAAREFAEETGLTANIEDFVDFPGNIFYARIPRKGGEVVNFSWHVYRVKNFRGDIAQVADNVTPMWVETSRLEQLDREGKLLPNVFNAVSAAMKENV